MDDRAALTRLAAEYAAAVDARDAERLVGLFTDDAVLTVPGPEPWVLRGRDAIAEIADALRGYDRTLHFVGLPVHRVDGDTATGQVPCTAHHLSVRDGAGVDQVWFIRYHDTYSRDATGWRIVERHITLLWTEEHPAALPPG